MKGSNWEEEKEGSSREGMRQMPKSSFHHDSHFIDEFVDLDELLRETLPQLGEAVKLIERQKETDQVSSDEAQEGQIKKRMEKKNRKKKRKKTVCTPSLSQRNEFESDLKKEQRREIMGFRVSENYSSTQESSAPHHTKPSSDEVRERENKHGKKRRKMGTKDLQRKKSELGFDLLAGEDCNKVLVGDNDQSKVLTLKEVWELRFQYLAMEARLQMLTFIKDLYIETMHSLKETIKETHS